MAMPELIRNDTTSAIVWTRASPALPLPSRTSRATVSVTCSSSA